MDGFFNPLIPCRSIERIKTNTLETSCPKYPRRFHSNTNGCVDELLLINYDLVGVFNFLLRDKGLCQNIILVVCYKLIVCLIDVQRFGLLFGKKDVIICM